MTRILRLEAWRVAMGLEVPYEVAYTKHEDAENVMVRLVTDGPHLGLGCAGPSPCVTGEDPEGVLRDLTEVAAGVVEGSELGAWGATLQALEEALPRSPSARAAVDLALHDLLGKHAGMPLYRLLGGARPSIETTITVGILPLDQTLAEVEMRRGQGFRAFKLKGGHDLDGDVARAQAVRAAVGPEAKLCFDPNQGYDVAQAVEFCRRTAAVGWAFLEQPTPQAHPAMLGEVGRQVDTPIMADESLMTMTDGLALAADPGVGLFNLKVMRVGGVARCRQLDALAQAGGARSMLGCMDESALAIAAGLAVALASPNVAHADLDGHVGLRGDPAPDALRLEEGVLYPAEGPGLGVADLPDP